MWILEARDGRSYGDPCVFGAPSLGGSEKALSGLVSGWVGCVTKGIYSTADFLLRFC